MEETEGVSRYWCHMCSQIVNPIMEIEAVKCPICESGFVEEMDSSPSRRDHPDLGGSNSDRALSLWAPILLGMMSNPRRRRRLRRLEFDDDAEDDDDNDNNRHREGETELDRELESIIRRRRRSSATILQLLQGIRAGMLSESENTDGDGERNNGERNNGERNNRENRDRERVIVINPFNQTIIVQGSYDSNQSQNQNRDPIGSLGDYFIGPGLDLLLQHLAENDPNRYGTPPAQKEAVEALPTVKIEENLQCSVCLDDFEVGTEAKEMPCKHKFHSGCILPWLELHSSCPVCRHQLPSDESKLHSDVSRNSSNNGGESNNNDPIGVGVEEGDGDGRNGNGRWFPVPLPWPFSSLFSSSGSENSSSTVPSSSSAPSTNAPGSSSHTDEN
ncbi:E3 ubiquitin-protein ligase SIRP1-like [Cornus florida]|uniref:E3 ubiquitin-protein ligase SIRP1-like n=1 Tax=Cornus florida TaxID=4283 RepID=UPI00289D3BF1|nr:E3 ubiquitin-protein ligase SIRP1-like [Cornus florida]XP_059628707.1 E3 ubiquitin-protein ligase SIRP1-like [Cornus florida]